MVWYMLDHELYQELRSSHWIETISFITTVSPPSFPVITSRSTTNSSWNHHGATYRMPTQYSAPKATVARPTVPVTQKLTDVEAAALALGGTHIAASGYALPIVKMMAQAMLIHLFSFDIVDHRVFPSKIRSSNSARPTRKPNRASIVNEYMPTYALYAAVGLKL